MRGWPRLAVLLTLLGLCATAQGDWQTRSWSRWEITGDSAELLFGVEQIELQRMRGSIDTDWLLRELEAGISLGDATQKCSLRSVARVAAADTLLQYRLAFGCAAALRDPVAGVRVFLGQSGSPLHYAEFEYSAGQHASALFTRAEPDYSLRSAPVALSVWRIMGRYLVLGFEHILAGTDHVAFLLCMLLASRRLGARLWMITGFTIGHSVTLSLSVLGLLSVVSTAVEALIGFTVALLAVEVFARADGRHFATGLLALVVAAMSVYALGGGNSNLPMQSLLALLLLTPCYLVLALRQVRPDMLHMGMTSVFGLVHGIGFASVLQVIGLPQGQRGWALAGFNLGVEAGQLLLLLVFALLIRFASKSAAALRPLAGERVAAAALCALGVYWLVERTIV